MSRPRRSIHPDTIYHLYQRGNNRAFIYESENDKAMFVKTLVETMDKYDLALLYYVIMDNHFHLVVRTGQNSLSEFMMVLQRKYTFRYNLRYQRSGNLYDGRFCSRPVENERQFRQLIHYVANNPVVAGLTSTPDEFPWCAHRVVIDGLVSLVDSDQLLSHFGSPPTQAMQEYKEMVSDGKPCMVARKDCFAVDKSELPMYLDRIMDSFSLSPQEQESLRKGECPEVLTELRNTMIHQMRDFGYSCTAISEYLSTDYFVVRRIAMKKAANSCQIRICG
jgi:REP element-mobilizing transposase RayT